MLLITGVGRSGTLYTTHVLRAAGYDVGHEHHLGAHGMVSWEWAIEADFYPNWHVCNQPEFDVILHQVRHPLKTIASCTKAVNKEAWRYIYANTPIDPESPLLQRCAEYWYHWTLYAEKRASWTYQVEMLDKLIGEFCERLGIPEISEKVLKSVPKNTHKGAKTEKLTWKDLEYSTPYYLQIREMAEGYGYT